MGHQLEAQAEGIAHSLVEGGREAIDPLLDVGPSEAVRTWSGLVSGLGVAVRG